MKQKLMLLGSNGLCGTSLVPLLEKVHPEIELILIDPSPEAKPPTIAAEVKLEELWHVLRSFKMGNGDILIDLAPSLKKTEVARIADNAGVSVINATSCEADRGTLGLIELLDPKTVFGRYEWNVPHILDGGMNPGNVNAMLGKLVEDAGENPLEVIQWELDSTIPYHWDGEGFATWSPEEFAAEFGDESTWEVAGRAVLFASGPPIDNLVKMPNGEYGALCQHEELLLWGWRYGCTARYLYGYPKKTLDAISRNIRAGLDLPLCRKLAGRIPTGGDRIGVMARFESGVKHGIFYADNEDDAIQIGSNATSYLVAVGLVTAIQMLKEGCPVGICFPDDFASRWISFIEKNKLCEISYEAPESEDTTGESS